MSEELHDVVKLMLARMESHPEEFVPEKEDHQYVLRDGNANRWWRAMSEVQEYANEQEKKAIAAKLRELRLQQAHEWAMDELCNGEERRRKEKRERELEEQRYNQGQALRASAVQNNINVLNTAFNNPQTSLDDLINSGHLKYQPGPDAYEFTEQGFTTSYTRETLEDNPGIIASIKKALGI